MSIFYTKFCFSGWKNRLIIFLYMFSAVANANDNCILKPQYADSYVLALNFYPGFCFANNYNHRGCTDFDQKYTHIFVLHGLWPSTRSCKKNYAYCNNTPLYKNWCAYPPLHLESVVSLNLKSIMPDYDSGLCFERYEWYKHGTCQLLSANDYYATAINLTGQINHSYAVELLKSSSNGYMKKSEFIHAFERSFGNGSSNRVKLLCTKGVLRELYINLPKIDKNTNVKLIDLLKQSTNIDDGNCPDNIKIL